MDVVPFLAGVQQEAGEFEAEIDVVRAAAPPPVRPDVVPLAPRVATARFQLALTASFGDGVSDSGRRDCVSKGRLPVPCKGKTKRKSNRIHAATHKTERKKSFSVWWVEIKNEMMTRWLSAQQQVRLIFYKTKKRRKSGRIIIIFVLIDGEPFLWRSCCWTGSSSFCFLVGAGEVNYPDHRNDDGRPGPRTTRNC